MVSTSQAGVLLGVLIFILVVVSIIYIIMETGYSKLINKESKLCLSSTCVYYSNQCKNTPFKVVDGQLTCADPNIFTGTFAGVNPPTV